MEEWKDGRMEGWKRGRMVAQSLFDRIGNCSALSFFYV
jgi:hypothetical protein